MKVSKLSKRHQKAWIDKVEQRLSATATVLGNMKAVKMLGLGSSLFRALERLRKIEIQTSRTFRKQLVWQLFLCELATILQLTANLLT